MGRKKFGAPPPFWGGRVGCVALLINVISVQKVSVCRFDNATHNLLKNGFHRATFALQLLRRRDVRLYVASGS